MKSLRFLLSVALLAIYPVALEDGEIALYLPEGPIPVNE